LRIDSLLALLALSTPTKINVLGMMQFWVAREIGLSLPSGLFFMVETRIALALLLVLYLEPIMASKTSPQVTFEGWKNLKKSPSLQKNSLLWFHHKDSLHSSSQGSRQKIKMSSFLFLFLFLFLFSVFLFLLFPPLTLLSSLFYLSFLSFCEDFDVKSFDQEGKREERKYLFYFPFISFYSKY